MLLTDQDCVLALPYNFDDPCDPKGVELFVKRDGHFFTLCVCGEWHRDGGCHYNTDAHLPPARLPTFQDFCWLAKHDYPLDALLQACPPQFRSKFSAFADQERQRLNARN